jgi:porphobilinogen synthase
LFVIEGEGIKNEIDSLGGGIFQMSIDEIVKECDLLTTIGINAIMLFALPSYKDEIGSEACNENSIISRCVKAIKSNNKNIYVITDLCFCEYTSHGHCGIIDDATKELNNDKTLDILNAQALIHAQAGVDMIAPSGMMDNIVISLRNFLDKNNFHNLAIMSYSTKFASAYYGPFRDIADSAPSFGDRKTYQMDFRNKQEAIEESKEDEKQGADIIMVKPVLAYLDIVSEIKQNTNIPLCVYNVSGEYAMLKHTGKAGIIDYGAVLMENMFSFKRAGADMIITYHAKEVLHYL